MKRKFIDIVGPIQDNGCVLQYEIEKASWIWHPEFSCDKTVFLHFINKFEIAKELTTTIHVSADHRYELVLDGELISRGPDRSDELHWAFASYEVTLSAGIHVFEANVHWIGDDAPAAQRSVHPGFIFVAQGLEELLNTGTGNWSVADRKGISFGPGISDFYHVIGSSFIVDGEKYCHGDMNYCVANPVSKLYPSISGVFTSKRSFSPTTIPEQKFDMFKSGKIRAINNELNSPILFSEESDVFAEFDFLNGDVTIPSNITCNILWDMNNYYCGYNHLEVQGGQGSKIKMEWAESLFRNETDNNGIYHYKDHRDEIVDKVFYGFGDTFMPSGKNDSFKSFWWRSGRYILLRITTSKDPLVLTNVYVETTRYPLENEAVFKSSRKELEEFIPIGVRGMQMCSHETLMDCPYYEQMMYAGDGRLELLTWYAMSSDVRFPKRCIELFDWSRWKTGFIAERYPSEPYQLSLTFSTIWVYMLHDFMMWRDDKQWIKQRLVGMRCLLENFRSLIQEDGLLHSIPGWSFIDWVDGWKAGMPAVDDDGLLSVINLQYVYALQKAAEIERFVGEDLMAERNIQQAECMKETILKTFWNENRKLLKDSVCFDNYSEHAQCLGILTETIPKSLVGDCFNAMLSCKNIAQTTIYYSFYLLETFHLMNRGDLIIDKVCEINKLVQNGFKTTIEKPEPSRSDCHAWGAHPIFHLHASLAGIRPLEPGFSKLLVKPSPGDLSRLDSELPHPQGTVCVKLSFDGDACCGSISLPGTVQGVFEWNKQQIILNSGDNNIGSMDYE